MKKLIAFLLVFAAIGIAPTSTLSAQEPQAASKQEQANKLFSDLTESMQRVQALLVKENPDDPDVDVIGNGLEFIAIKKIRENMDLAKQMLGEEEWDDALGKMQEVKSDLKTLLDLLQNRNLDLQKLLARIQQLQGFRDEVDRLAKEQAQEKEDSARAEALQQQLEDIAKAKTKAEQLLAEQKELRGATNDLGLQAAADATEPLENKQGELKEDAFDLADDLEKIERKAEALAEEAAEPEAAGDPKDGQPDAGKPNAGKPSDGKPNESKPSESKPSESKPSDGKPSDGKPNEGKPNEGKPGESKPGAGKPGSCSSCAQGAAQSMQKSQDQLGQNQPEPSLKDQDQAIEKLESTLKELEEMAEDARRELEKLPFEQMARKQEQTEHATDTLAQKMEQAEEGDESGAGEPTPGRKSVQQAVPKQKAAAGQLKEYKPAKQKQQDAKEDLDRAREELDEALAQLRQQLQDEVLRALEERFTAMLAKQRELSLQTRTLDKTREQVLTADGSLPSALVERIQTVASGEYDLEGEASDALKLLEEEGTTAVFPEIVAELQDQLRDVGDRCSQNATGKVVQQKQLEVEDTLALLINALRRTIERREGG